MKKSITSLVLLLLANIFGYCFICAFAKEANIHLETNNKEFSNYTNLISQNTDLLDLYPDLQTVKSGNTGFLYLIPDSIAQDDNKEYDVPKQIKVEDLNNSEVEEEYVEISPLKQNKEEVNSNDSEKEELEIEVIEREDTAEEEIEDNEELVEEKTEDEIKSEEEEKKLKRKEKRERYKRVIFDLLGVEYKKKEKEKERKLQEKILKKKEEELKGPRPEPVIYDFGEEEVESDKEIEHPQVDLTDLTEPEEPEEERLPAVETNREEFEAIDELIRKKIKKQEVKPSEIHEDEKKEDLQGFPKDEASPEIINPFLDEEVIKEMKLEEGLLKEEEEFLPAPEEETKTKEDFEQIIEDGRKISPPKKLDIKGPVLPKKEGIEKEELPPAKVIKKTIKQVVKKEPIVIDEDFQLDADFSNEIDILEEEIKKDDLGLSDNLFDGFSDDLRIINEFDDDLGQEKSRLENELLKINDQLEEFELLEFQGKDIETPEAVEEKINDAFIEKVEEVVVEEEIEVKPLEKEKPFVKKKSVLKEKPLKEDISKKKDKKEFIEDKKTYKKPKKIAQDEDEPDLELEKVPGDVSSELEEPKDFESQELNKVYVEEEYEIEEKPLSGRIETEDEVSVEEFYSIEDEVDEEVLETFKKKVVEQIDVPPEVILNDQKIIFKRQPMFNGGVWLFPIEEIAERLNDEVLVDPVNQILTVSRFKDRVDVQVNLNNGLVTINNRPFRNLRNYSAIVLEGEQQLVPVNALVLLHGLTANTEIPGKVILKSILTASARPVTVQPKKTEGLKGFITDYLTTTSTYNNFRNADFVRRRFEVNAGAHNDVYVAKSDLVFRGGTDSPFLLFDMGGVSLFKRESIFQASIIDAPLTGIRSPLLSGFDLRGVLVQLPTKFKDSKLIAGLGLLPSNQKIEGKQESFLTYKRLAQVAEFSHIPKDGWQYSIGEGLYHDAEQNVFTNQKQTGGLIAGNISKTGKYFETESNLGFSFVNNKDGELEGSSAAPGGSLLLRLKPKKWLSFYGQGDYYDTEFFTIFGNPFYTDRKQLTGGVNLTFPKISFGGSISKGETNLDNDDPDEFDTKNFNVRFKPFKWSPTFLGFYTKNETMISATRAVRDVVDPINDGNINNLDMETIIGRRANSLFRLSATQNFKNFNYLVSFSSFDLDSEVRLENGLLDSMAGDKINTFDVNINRRINDKITVQNLSQVNTNFKRNTVGLFLGPFFNRRASFQFNAGVTSPEEGDTNFIFTGSANLQLTKKINLNLSFINSDFREEINAILQWNILGKKQGLVKDPQRLITNGNIRGKVIVVEEPEEPETKEVEGEVIALPPKPIEKGVPDVRVRLGNRVVETDANGNYVFEGIRAGLHRVNIEYTDIPAYLTAVSPQTVDVSVEPAKDTFYNFVLGYFGSAKGRVEVVGEPPYGVKPLESFSDIRVYLEDSEAETLTLEDGEFELTDVKPGRYKISIDPEWLPDTLKFVDEEQYIEVTSKKELRGLVLKITYKEREGGVIDFDEEPSLDAVDLDDESSSETNEEVQDAN